MHVKGQKNNNSRILFVTRSPIIQGAHTHAHTHTKVLQNPNLPVFPSECGDGCVGGIGGWGKGDYAVCSILTNFVRDSLFYLWEGRSLE